MDRWRSCSCSAGISSTVARCRRPTARCIDEFAAKLGEWSWDVALLQEVPPWWPQRLARRARRRAVQRADLAQLAAARCAARSPSAVRSCSRQTAAAATRSSRARRSPSTARCACVAGPSGASPSWRACATASCVVNLHASTRPARARQELERLWPRALAWAGTDRLILGGDLNVRSPAPPPATIVHAAASGVDHVFARGLVPATSGGSASGTPSAPDRPGRELLIDGRRVELSDHAPLLTRLCARAD